MATGARFLKDLLAKRVGARDVTLHDLDIVVPAKFVASRTPRRKSTSTAVILPWRPTSPCNIAG
jgi:hypothetical protein